MNSYCLGICRVKDMRRMNPPFWLFSFSFDFITRLCPCSSVTLTPSSVSMRKQFLKWVASTIYRLSDQRRYRPKTRAFGVRRGLEGFIQQNKAVAVHIAVAIGNLLHLAFKSAGYRRQGNPSRLMQNESKPSRGEQRFFAVIGNPLSSNTQLLSNADIPFYRYCCR